MRPFMSASYSGDRCSGTTRLVHADGLRIPVVRGFSRGGSLKLATGQYAGNIIRSWRGMGARHEVAMLAELDAYEKGQMLAAATVLIVEDDLALVHAIARNLVTRGYGVETAETVSAALEALRVKPPALILLDIEMPDGSGWEVLRHMRETGQQDVPAIVMSALRPNPRLVQEMGCAGVLEKPFPMDSLIRMVVERVGPPPGRPAVDPTPELNDEGGNSVV
jgi:CheY-like chemotaxis protein